MKNILAVLAITAFSFQVSHAFASDHPPKAKTEVYSKSGSEVITFAVVSHADLFVERPVEEVLTLHYAAEVLEGEQPGVVALSNGPPVIVETELTRIRSDS